jgi:hypothetical protein
MRWNAPTLLPYYDLLRCHQAHQSAFLSQDTRRCRRFCFAANQLVAQHVPLFLLRLALSLWAFPAVITSAAIVRELLWRSLHLQWTGIAELVRLVPLLFAINRVDLAACLQRQRPPHLLFVYGTLKAGFQWHEKYMTGAVRLGKAVTVDRFALVVGDSGVPYVLGDLRHGVDGNFSEVECVSPHLPNRSQPHTADRRRGVRMLG